MLLRVFAAVTFLAAFSLPCTISFSKTPYHKDRRSDTPLFRFEEKGQAGFINSEGKVVIPPKFDIGWFSEEDFVEGLSPARLYEHWGFIDQTGNWVIETQFRQVQPFSEGLAAVTYPLQGFRSSKAYIDKTGRVIVALPNGVTSVEPFSEGMAAVFQYGPPGASGFGYIDRSGALLIPHQFAVAGPFHEEEREGRPATTPPSVPGMAGSCVGGVPDSITEPSITEQCGEGFINKSGKVVFRFQGVRDFSEGLAAVEQDGAWGFIDTQGKFRVQPRFESVRSFHDGLAAVGSGGKWGYIDRDGRSIIRLQFAKADDFSDNLALTDKGYIDKTGNVVAAAKDGTAFVLGLAHVNLGNGEFGYINHLGKIVFRYRPDAVNPSLTPYSSH